MAATKNTFSKIISGISLACFAVLCLASCQSAQKELPLSPYSNREKQLNLLLPEGWQLTESSGPTIFFASDSAAHEDSPMGTSINLTSIPVPDGIGLEQFCDEKIKSAAANFQAFKSSESRNITLADSSPAKIILCSYSIGKFSMKALICMTVHDKEGFVLAGISDASCFDRHLALFEKVASSLSFSTK
ncbi:MAG: hypothetical protein A2X49_05275 [Lentisphaerae bacterium GWF2_52_8]|nr:MAG: hypothetical protein A2X49_05275 [Lentisphaerae bacterium GWF2_52_8]